LKGERETKYASTLAMGRTRVDRRAIGVLRLSPDVAERLRTAPRDAGRVHSVFERALNLDWHDGRLLTLHGPGRLLAPFAAALARPPRGAALRPGLRVCRRDDTLALDGIVLDWHGAATVDTAMPESRGALGPALSGLPAPSQAQSGRGLLSTAGRDAQSRLAEGVAGRDSEAFIEGALGLIGLGEGLTPAGDDCLVGVLAVMHRFERPWMQAHPAIAATVGRVAATATTLVAAEFIAHALAGRFAESLIDLMTAGSTDEVRRAAAQVLRSGATSGADTLCGVRLALDALGASRGSAWS
jgi:hypothetical protein